MDSFLNNQEITNEGSFKIRILGGWVADNNNILTLTIGDDTYPVYDFDSDGIAVGNANPQATGGGSYIVALQQCRFQLDAGREDRWIVQMQFVCESRKDTKGRVFPIES